MCKNRIEKNLSLTLSREKIGCVGSAQLPTSIIITGFLAKASANPVDNGRKVVDNFGHTF